MLRINGFDDCIMGVAHTAGEDQRIVYDLDLVLKKLIADGLSPSEAWEHYEYNMLGAIQPGTLVFLDRTAVLELS